MESAWRSVPVISVAPVRGPMLDGTKTRYVFPEAKQFMCSKLRTILRIAMAEGHRTICLGSFGLGPIFKNPPREVAEMWRDLLFSESEFVGQFDNVFFAFDTRVMQSGFQHCSKDDFALFQSIFDPKEIVRVQYERFQQAHASIAVHG